MLENREKMENMSVQSTPTLFEKPYSRKKSSATNAAVKNSGASTDTAMNSPRRKATKNIKSGRPLVSLSLARDKKLSNLVEVIEPSRQRDELILSPQNIRAFVGLLEEFRRADTLRRHGLSIRSKLLFCGPPGCGKTVTAEVFAHELGLPLLVARLDTIISSYLGETASNLRNVFEVASNEPCVLFLDEFDALARTRTEGAEHGELRRVVNSLLLMIDKYHGRGFLIAATNLEESLDAAIWRRFDDVILFDHPREKQIRQFIELKTRNFPLNFDLSKAVSKLDGLSYADIERICINAIKRSILKDLKQIDETAFSVAIREEMRRQQVRMRIKF